MKKMTLILLSALSAHAYTNEISISYTKKNSLILRGDTCSELHDEYVKICDWKKTVDLNFSVPPEERAVCRTLSNGKKQIIVSKCLPKLIKSYQRKKQYNDGANCWGTAMHLKGISEFPRYVWGKEMTYWQESPLCKRLEASDELKAGDILNIYGPEYIFNRDEFSKGDILFNTLYPTRKLESLISSGYSGYHNFLHSETFISSKLTFGKDSPNKDDRFLVKNIGEVYGRSRNKDCQENSSLIPNIRENNNKPSDVRSGKCGGYFSNAYRCENFNQYFSRNIKNSAEEKIYSEIKKLQKIQKELSKLQTLYNFKLSKVKINEYLSTADSDSSSALKELEKNNDKNLEMLLVLKFFTAHGIRKTLEQSYLIEATELL